MEFYYIFLWINLCSSAAVFENCPPECQHENATLKCYGIIPNDECIDPFIYDVIVLETTFVGSFNFRGRGWKHIKSLSLNPELYAHPIKQGEVEKDIYENEFEGLDSLEKLQIACRCLYYINSGAFKGLDKLRILDLSNNEMLALDHLEKGFWSNTLPNLSELYMFNSSRSVSLYSMLELTPEFFQNIARTRLKVFNISETQAWAEDNCTQEAFPFLEQLNMSNSPLSLSILTAFHKSKTSFQRLRILDLSYLQTESITDPLFISGKTRRYNVPFQLSELYMKKIFKTSRKVPPVKANLTHLCFLQQPNKSDDKLCFIGKLGNLKKLVAAENSITYLDPNTVNSFPNLQYIDMSSNFLGHLVSEDFIQSISEKLSKLETLILSKNEIETIPRNSLLTNTNLRHLDLSYNNLESVTFDTYNLTSLKVLDLRFNKITFLDAQSIRKLSDFLNLNVHVSRHGNETKELKLTGNPFTCTCEHVRSLQWLAQLNQELACKQPYEGHIIDDSLIKQVQYDCKLTIVIAVYCSYVSIVLIVFGLLIFIMIKLKSKYNRRKQVEEGVRKYGERANKQEFPVFLSFCCEDDEIVMGNIYPNLERGLQKILQTDAPCVATGYSCFRPGYPLAEEIIRCVEASSVIVFFMTNKFCEKEWCRHETIEATNQNKTIIFMEWENINVNLMPRYLYNLYRHNTLVHWVLDEGGQRKMRPNWEELCEDIVSKFVENTDARKNYIT